MWQLTEPGFKGKIFFKDPNTEAVGLNFLVMLTSEEWTSKLETACKDYYDKDWSADSGFKSAAYQWIDGFLANCNYTYAADGAIAEGVSTGAAGNVGLFVFSKLRSSAVKRENLAIGAYEAQSGAGLNGFSGFLTSTYAQICRDTEGAYKVYFGNLHAHTGFSDGSCTPEYAYDYARCVAGLDFLGITEHTNMLDEPFDSAKSRKWRDLKRYAEEKTENGAFLALTGSETSWYNQFGHMNIYGADFYINPYELKYNRIDAYYGLLKTMPHAINQWNHPWGPGHRHLDLFEPYDPEFDKVICTMEINPFVTPDSDALYYYILALDKGWHISPVGSQDNHHPDWGTENQIRTAVLAAALTKADFYGALRHRRTYFTVAPHLRVFYSLGGAIMGSRVRAESGETVRVSLLAENPQTEAKISGIEILGQGDKICLSKAFSAHSVSFSADLSVNGRYYFAKVYQENGEFAATAPVWIEP